MKTLKLTTHEKVLTRVLNTNEQLVIFDIGACDGLSSLRYSEIFSNSIIYAFEPVPENFNIIIRNKEKHKLGNLIPYMLGLSSEPGKAELYLSSGQPTNKPADSEEDFGNKSSSLLRPDKATELHPWLKFNKTIEIRIETLDNFCKNQNIVSIDFIHMDVQGAEIMVLQGGEKMLASVKSIWLEVERITLYENQPIKKDVELFLQKHNFSLALNELNHACGDQLWLNKSIIQQLDKHTQFYLFKMRIQSQLRSIIYSFLGGIRYKLKLRTRLQSFFKRSYQNP